MFIYFEIFHNLFLSYIFKIGMFLLTSEGKITFLVLTHNQTFLSVERRRKYNYNNLADKKEL